MMQNLSPPRIFSKSRRQAMWQRALGRQGRTEAAKYLLDNSADDLVERVEFMRLAPARTLVIGDQTRKIASNLGKHGIVETLDCASIDEEAPLAVSNLDLLVHLFGFATINDLPGALIHSRNALRDGGVMMASFPGSGSLETLRAIMLAADNARPAPRIHPLIDNSAAAALLQRAGFRRQVVDSHSLTVRYSSLDRLISDLRDQGLTNVLRQSGPPLTKQAYGRAKQAFEDLAGDDGKITETFEILTLTGWK